MSKEKTGGENVEEESEDLLEEWPFSNNFILAAILLLIAAAFTLAFRTEEKANQYAIWAYYALVIGVFLRFVEIVLEERFDLELKPWTYRKLEPLTSRLEANLKKFKDRVIELLTPYKHSIEEKLEEVRRNGETEEHEGEAEVSRLRRVLSRLKAVSSGLTSYSLVKEVYVCEECGARFGSRELLKEHRNKNHS